MEPEILRYLNGKLEILIQDYNLVRADLYEERRHLTKLFEDKLVKYNKKYKP